MNKLNPDVTQFLDTLNHPLRAEIEGLRQIIIESLEGLSENIKWNGPNYTYQDDDRITMKIQPPKQIQLIFHRGAKKLEQPTTHLIEDPSGLLTWKENDRAIVSFKSMQEISHKQTELIDALQNWIKASTSHELWLKTKI